MDFLRKLIFSFSGIFIIGIIGLIVVFIYRQFVYFPRAVQEVGENTLAIDFVIDSGESVRNVALRLEEIGVVKDEWVLVNHLTKQGLDTQVEAGHFNFRGGEKVAEVAQILLAGETAQIPVTILEGWNSAEIDVKLVELGLISENDFALFVREGGSTAGNEEGSIFADRPVASLEGYLFPATYKIDPASFSVESLAERMLKAMERNLNELGWDTEASPKSLHEILTLASIVELEERSESNRPKVADILWRRIEEGIGLYADATLFYALGHKEILTAADLAIDSPYNTRKNRGLPPTPIASPSRSAINAALHPELNDSWYYLHDSDGVIHFAETLTEHNKNKAEYISQ
jgi:UPF0755 protein